MSNKLTLLFFIFAISLPFTIIAQDGCTDPLASNYDMNAINNDGSCQYATTNYLLNLVGTLEMEVQETSGLLFVEDQLWTHGDSGNENKLYQLDTITGAIIKDVKIANAENADWEDITQDDQYIYVGDFGNNDGARTDLKIYRILKSGLSLDVVNADIINFEYEDQTEFIPNWNNNDFDCESIIYRDNNLHVFSKNWVDNKTRHYTIPATLGNHVAQLQSTFDVGGLITGADINEDGVLAMIGYTEGGANFMWLFSDYNQTDFFTGNKRRIELGSAIINSQTEAIVFKDNMNGFVSGESQSFLPPRLFNFNIKNFIFDYINSVRDIVIDNQKVSVFPNPVENELNIKLVENYTGTATIKIFTSMGQLVYQEQLELVYQNGIGINTASFPTGTYLLNIQTKDFIANQRIMVVK